MKLPNLSAKILILAAIVAVGIILRVYHLTANPLWIDEGWTLYVSTHGWMEIPFLDVHPPVHYWLIKIVTSVIGTGEAAIRATSVAFGVAAVVMAYLFGREFTGHDWPGLVAAGIMAVTPDQIFHSQDARSYTIWVTVWMVFMIFYLRSMDHPDSKRGWVITGALAGLLMWVHYWSIFPLAFLGMYALWRNKRALVAPVYGVAVFTGIFIPLIPIFLRGISIKSVEGWTIFHPWNVILQNTWMAFSGGNTVLAILFLVFTCIGLFLLLENRKYSMRFEIAMILFASTVIVFLASSPWFMVIPKYAMYLAPIVYSLVGAGVCAITVPFVMHNKKLGAIVIALVMICSAVPLTSYYAETNRGGWYDHNKELTAITNGGPVAILANPGLFTQWEYYYSGETVPFYNTEHLEWYAHRSNHVRGFANNCDVQYFFVPTGDLPDDVPEAKRIYNYLQENGEYITTYRGFEGWRVG